MSDFYKACQNISAQFWDGRCLIAHSEILDCSRESRATIDSEVCSDWAPSVAAAEGRLKDNSEEKCRRMKVDFGYPVDSFISCEPVADSKRVETQSAFRYRASGLVASIVDWFRNI